MRTLFLSQDVLEKKIEELSRQLAEERQLSRQNRMSVARLQREITRFEAAEKRPQVSKQDSERNEP